MKEESEANRGPKGFPDLQGHLGQQARLDRWAREENKARLGLLGREARQGLQDQLDRLGPMVRRERWDP